MREEGGGAGQDQRVAQHQQVVHRQPSRHHHHHWRQTHREKKLRDGTKGDKMDTLQNDLVNWCMLSMNSVCNANVAHFYPI